MVGNLVGKHKLAVPAEVIDRFIGYNAHHPRLEGTAATIGVTVDLGEHLHKTVMRHVFGIGMIAHIAHGSSQRITRQHVIQSTHGCTVAIPYAFDDAFLTQNDCILFLNAK